MVLAFSWFVVNEGVSASASDYYEKDINSTNWDDIPNWNSLPVHSIGADSNAYVKLNVPGEAEAYSCTFNAQIMHNQTTHFDNRSTAASGGWGGFIVNQPSRVIFATKIKVEAGTVLSVVGATEDGRTYGGSDVDDGNTFYWTIMEFDANGYAIYDGDWRSTYKTWTVGTERNTVDGHDNSLAPKYQGKNEYKRAQDVAYVMIVVRVASGDLTQGAGNDLTMSRSLLASKFPNMYVVGYPFEYWFIGNGGTVHYGNNAILRRMGVSPYIFDTGSNEITSEKLAFPTVTRSGHAFAGWKLTTGGKQQGNIYYGDGSFMSDGVKYSSGGNILSDGRFYSSLFSEGGATYFVAQWDIVNYNISYDLQGGTVSSANRTSYTINDTFTLNNPTRLGYRFVGWTGSNGSTPQTTVHIAAGTTGDLSYTANWESAEVGATVQHYVMDVNGDFPSTPTKTTNATVIIGRDFESYGYNYFKDSSLEQAGVISVSGYIFPSSGVVSADASKNVVKIYYSRKAYTVKYNVSYNGGMWDEYDNSDLVEYEYYGASANLSYKAVKNGYEFVGWNTDKDATTALSTVTITSDTTLYAVYKKTIKIGFTDALGRREKQVTVYNRTSQGDIVTPYVRDNSSWNDVSAKVAIGWTTSNNVNATNGTISELDAGKSITVSDSEEYYAVYKGFGKVTFDENGGTETDTTEDKLIPVYKNAGNLNEVLGGDITMPGCDRPDRNNGDGTVTSFQLKGWQTSGSDTVYPSGSSVTIKGNTDLIAVWDSATRDIEYTIVFDMNGGKDGPDPVKVKYGDEVTLQDKGSKVGFKLDGWNTKPDGTGTAYDKTAVVKNLTTEDGATVTLFAQWKKKEFFLVKISSSRYNATFIRRTEGDDAWFNSVGKITIQEWSAMTEEEKTAISKYRFHIDKDGNRTQIK